MSDSPEVLARRIAELEERFGLTYKEHVDEQVSYAQIERRIERLDVFLSGRTTLGQYDDVFDGCNACAFMDIDATIERNGHFLVVEMKTSGASWSLPMGQRIYFLQMSKIPNFTVIVRWGDDRSTERIRIFGKHQYAEPCNEDEFRHLLKYWWNTANRNQTPDVGREWDKLRGIIPDEVGKKAVNPFQLKGK